MKKRNAIVTGGAGFIGSVLTKALIADGWDILVLDNLRTGFESNIPKEADFLKCDLSETGFEKKLPKNKFDVVFHLAAQSSGEISYEDPEYDIKTNAVGTLKLLDWCKTVGVKRFLYASSMSVYGDALSPVSEEANPKPLSLYGVGKLASENYIRLYQNLGVNSTSLRLFNVYGPGQNMNNLKQGMVSIYMAYIAKKEPILVKGSKDRYRDFVYIDDIVNAFLSCLDCEAAYGNIYNVGTGTQTFVYELLDQMVEAFGYKKGEYPISFQGSTPGDQLGIFADTSKIQEQVNWQAKGVLKQGLIAMREWLSNGQ